MSPAINRREKGEGGAVLVLVAVCLPALALLAAFAIDVAHWYDYSRNLQLRADAAALAAGDQYGGICGATTPSATAMAAIGKMAQLYSGPPAPLSATDTPDLFYPYSGAGSPLEPGALPAPNSAYMNVPNLKAGHPGHYHVLLNSDHYWTKSNNETSATASFTMGPASTFCHSTDENGNVGAMVDVRVTQDSLPLFFPLLNIKPTISAHARVGIESVSQENNIRPLAVRDAGLTPCVTVKLINTGNGNVVQTVHLDHTGSITGGADIWTNPSAGTSVDVPPGANLYAQTILHAQGNDNTCNTSSNPLTYEQNSGILLLNSYNDPPVVGSTVFLDPSGDGTTSAWSKSSGTTAWNLLNDGNVGIRSPNGTPRVAPGSGQITNTSTEPATPSQDLAFPDNAVTWNAGDTYTLRAYGDTASDAKRGIFYQVSTDNGATWRPATPSLLFGDGVSPSWHSADISSFITSTADINGLQVRLINERGTINGGAAGSSTGTARVDEVYVERTPAGPKPQIVGTSAAGGGVTLVNAGTCAPDAYFSTSASCGVKVCAIVWFTPDATAGSRTVTLSDNGNALPNLTLNGDSLCTTNVPGATAWASNVISINPQSGQHQFTLGWSEKSASLGCDTGPPCTGSFGVQQQTFAACDEQNASNTCADPNYSGPIVLAEIGEANTLNNTAGSFHSGTRSLSITVEIQGLQNAKLGDPPTGLKYGTSSAPAGHATGLIDCGQGNGAAGDKAAIFFGCPPVGSSLCNNTPYCAPLIKSPDGSCNNSLRATTPGIAVDCVNINNGTIASVPDCIAARIVIGGGSNPNQPCNSPNNNVQCSRNAWPTQDWQGGDPRAITMIITFPADLSTPNAIVPIRTFATFYVTGWSLQGNSPDCGVYDAATNTGGNETFSNSAPGEIWGHWITYTDPGAGSDGTPCNFQAFGNCTAVLSR